MTKNVFFIYYFKLYLNRKSPIKTQSWQHKEQHKKIHINEQNRLKTAKSKKQKMFANKNKRQT